MIHIKSNKGFTLLEIIAALAIIGITMGYLLLIREENIELGLKTHDSRMAKVLARYKLEEIYLEGFSKVGSGGEFKDHKGFKWEASLVPVSPLEGVNLEEIRVTVKYGKKYEFNYSLKMWKYISQKTSEINNSGPQ